MSGTRPQAPWPAPTLHHPAKRRRVVERREVGLGLGVGVERRQTIADQDKVIAAQEACQINSGNYVISCFPTADTSIPQSQWASFVWNSRRPELTQTNLVDVFLFRADSQQQMLHFRQLPNPSDQAGLVRAQVNDSWFGEQGKNWNGKDVAYPYYWVIIRSDKTLDGNQVPQPIFTAVQTTVLDSVAASSSSSAAAASSSSEAAALSTRTQTANPTSTGGGVQQANSGSSFPRWAIAVIVVLGFLAIATTCILTFLILRRVRRRRRQESIRNSMGSSSPMIVHPNRDSAGGGAPSEMAQRYADSPGSPLLPPPSIAAAGAGSAFVGGAALGRAGSGHGHDHDGASTNSDSGGPFSGADAAIMADAFRKMLRKPDFAGRPVEEGESPEQPEGVTGSKHGSTAALGKDGSIRSGIGPSALGPTVTHPEAAGTAVMSRELAEEGRDIRSVSSSRGVTVESYPESTKAPPSVTEGHGHVPDR